MTEYSDPITDLLGHEEHVRFAKIVGEYMVGIILDGSIAEINQNSIEADLGFKMAIDRWGAAQRILSRPRPGIPGEEDLTAKETDMVWRAGEKRSSLKDLSVAIKNDRMLRRPLRGFKNFAGAMEGHVDELLNHGVIDTAQWLVMMYWSDIDFDSMKTHPSFLVATGLTNAGHFTLFGALEEQILKTNRARIPSTRQEAMGMMGRASSGVVANSLFRARTSNRAALTARGFCPSGRMKDKEGNTWVHLLAGQGVKLLQAMPPEV